MSRLATILRLVVIFLAPFLGVIPYFMFGRSNIDA